MKTMTARVARPPGEQTEEGMLRELADLASARERKLRELALISQGRPGAAPTPQNHAVVQEVLAEVDVEGATYRLTRLRERPPAVDVTPRELEIARLVARGLATKEISAELKISSWTVLTHLRRLFTRLNVNTRSAMVKRLSDEGLV